MTEIKISWEGPFNIKEITDGSIDKKECDTKANDIGLYQIYGSHPIYGDNVLVYIGRTKGKNGFKSRLKNRWVVESGSDSENVQIYLGTIFSDSKKLEKEEILDNKLIDKAEVLLINALKPAFNSSNIQSVDTEISKDRFMLHNDGNYRRLPATLDSDFFWKEYFNYQVINKLSEVMKIKIEYEDEFCGTELNNIFNLSTDYIIWFGVDYEIWSEKKIPLMFQIYSDDKNVMNKINNSDKYSCYTYKVNKDSIDCFYLDDHDFNINDDNKTFEQNFSNKVYKIKEDLDRILKQT